MNIAEMKIAVQRALPDAGPADGVDGIRTWTAIHREIVLKKPPAPVVEPPVDDNGGEIDPRSAKAILTLLPEVREPAKLLIRAALRRGIEIKVTSALRTYEEQDALYEQGRSKPNGEGKWATVTDVRGGYSSHNFGTAFDITIFLDGKPVWESPKYKVVGQLGKDIGLSWGGDWSKPDEPHFYLKPDWAKNLTETQLMAQLRKRKTTGQKVYT